MKSLWENFIFAEYIAEMKTSLPKPLECLFVSQIQKKERNTEKHREREIQVDNKQKID